MFNKRLLFHHLSTCKQPKTQKCQLNNLTSQCQQHKQLTKLPSSTKPNDTKITPMTPLLRPSIDTPITNSILENHSKPVESDNKCLMPMKPANNTGPQATRQPLLPIPQTSTRINSYQQLLTRPTNSAIYNQHITGPSNFATSKQMMYTATHKSTKPSGCTRQTKINHHKTSPVTESTGNSQPNILSCNNSDINRLIYKLTNTRGKNCSNGTNTTLPSRTVTAQQL